MGLKKVEECRLCPTNTYNNQQGATGCKPCGKFAQSEEGSSKCSCIGAFRSYSGEDASCRCRSGYIFQDEDGKELGDVSATSDCARKTFDDCDLGGGDATKKPRSPDGECVAGDECKDACPDGKGKRSATLGVCACDNIKPVDEICNASCRRNAPTMTRISQTKLSIKGPNDKKARIVDLTDSADVSGSMECDHGKTCDVKSVTFGSSGPTG